MPQPYSTLSVPLPQALCMRQFHTVSWDAGVLQPAHGGRGQGRGWAGLQAHSLPVWSPSYGKPGAARKPQLRTHGCTAAQAGPLVVASEKTGPLVVASEKTAGGRRQLHAASSAPAGAHRRAACGGLLPSWTAGPPPPASATRLGAAPRCRGRRPPRWTGREAAAPQRQTPLGRCRRRLSCQRASQRVPGWAPSPHQLPPSLGPGLRPPRQRGHRWPRKRAPRGGPPPPPAQLWCGLPPFRVTGLHHRLIVKHAAQSLSNE